jgi:ABC-2 type transport system ATP-binding protein
MEKIRMEHVTKRYGKITAIQDVSLTIGEGVFGLLGHNGAGKSTLMKMIVTINAPTQGKIFVLGQDSRTGGDQIRREIGYLPQELGMYPSMRVRDFVAYIAALKGVKDKHAVESVLDQVEMLQYASRPIRSLSGGMRRRVGIAQAIVGSPAILVVDEPTAGLDPEERIRFHGLLSRYAAGGRTVILSTHIVEDVRRICDQLAVLREGNLFYSGPSEGLLMHVTGKVRTVELACENDLIELQKRAVVLGIFYMGTVPVARIVDPDGFYPHSIPVQETLEDAYIFCMGGKKNEKTDTCT